MRTHAGYKFGMDAALVIGFYVLVALLVIRVRRVTLAIAALVLASCLAVALIAQATLSSGVGGHAALGLVIAVVMIGLAVQFGAWASEDEESGVES
jgi:peptidoglycan/LPS O-acetylase OafA/YrhL